MSEKACICSDTVVCFAHGGLTRIKRKAKNGK